MKKTMPLNTDTAWELWGARDPYYGVLTDPKFRAAVMTAHAKDEFFALGRYHVNSVVNACRHHVDPEFSPQTVLDFGCGVGRLLIPFAEIARNVVGVDVSPSMLAEAKRNCDERGLENVTLVESDDEFSAVPGMFDLVHSCLVLQHIEISRGRKIFEMMIRKVRPGGCCAVQITFGSTLHTDTFGTTSNPSPELPQNTRSQARARLKKIIETLGLHSRVVRSRSEMEIADPEMQMNFYNVSELMFIMQRLGVKSVFSELHNYGGPLGVFLYFQKPL